MGYYDVSFDNEKEEKGITACHSIQIGEFRR